MRHHEELNFYSIFFYFKKKKNIKIIRPVSSHRITINKSIDWQLVLIRWWWNAFYFTQSVSDVTDIWRAEHGSFAHCVLLCSYLWTFFYMLRWETKPIGTNGERIPHSAKEKNILLTSLLFYSFVDRSAQQKCTCIRTVQKENAIFLLASVGFSKEETKKY